MKRIEPIEMNDILDRRDYELKYFWEYIGNKSDRTEKMNVESSIMELIKQAKSIILIKSHTVLGSEIIEALRKAHSKWVRIYILLKEIKEPSWLDFGITHIYKDHIFSSYVLIDPFGKIPRGMWFNKNIPQIADFVLTLDAKVVRELAGHFSREFWNSKPEIFFGKNLSSVEYPSDIPYIPPTLNHTSTDITHPALSESDIELASLPGKVMEIGEEFWNERDFIMDSKNLVIPLDDISKDLMEEIRDYEANVFGGAPKFGYIKLGSDHKRSFVFMPDILLEIPEDLKDEVDKNVDETKQWKFIRSKRLRDIKNKIILWDTEWNESKSIDIKDRDILELDNLECKNIDDWINYKNLPRPKLPPYEEIPLALTVELKWKILPPYLPEGSKKHKLYSKWEDFGKKMLKVKEDMLKNIEKEMEIKKHLKNEKKLKKSHYKTFEGKIAEIKEMIESIYSNDRWYGNNVESEKLIEKLIKIKNDLLKLSEEYMPNRGDDKTESDNELKELEKKKPTKNQIRNITIPSKEDIPRSLPELGELYEYNNRAFLAIEYEEEISQAKKLAERYNAKVVVKR